MTLVPLKAFTDNYIWLLINHEKQSAICVDPGEAAPVQTYLAAHQLKLDMILLTHHHYDHTNGVEALLTYFPEVMLQGPADARFTSTTPLSHDKEFHWNRLHFKRLETPGHTASHICYYESNGGLLFCGDTLFSAGCGRNFEGTPQTLLDSLTLLNTLPAATQIYCGHEYTRQNLRFAASIEPDNEEVKRYAEQLAQNPEACSLPSTLALERKINPFLRLDAPQIKDYVLSKGKAGDALSVFTQIRNDKNHFS